ncbi:hypothetical protein HQ520_08115, partial [bacterium]|nr:hypothetical protein [bacterium]
MPPPKRGAPAIPNTERFPQAMPPAYSKKYLSLQTQILLVFLLCLGLIGMGVVFLNTYLIAILKDQMKEQALLLAREA